MIKLRPLDISDVDEEYFSWYQNFDGHLDHFTGSGREFTLESIITDIEKGKSTGYWYYYIIETKEKGLKIGNVKIGPIDIKNRTADLVCLIGNRKFLGKGLAKEAIEIGNKIAFENHKIRRLQGGMLEGNVASIKAYTNAGWFIEATFKGYYLVAEKPVNRVCVACLNPKYFPNAKRS